MEFVQLVIKTTTGNTVVRQPISWAWPGNRCMYQVTFLNPASTQPPHRDDKNIDLFASLQDWN